MEPLVLLGNKTVPKELHRFYGALPPDFKLTSFAGLRGGVGKGQGKGGCKQVSGCIGLDSAMISVRNGPLYLLQTTDFFYPLIDDPYIMGQIACANVLSDLYAMGATECCNMLMLVGVSTEMSESECDSVYTLMMRGFEGRKGFETKCWGGTIRLNKVLKGNLILKDKAKEAGSCVKGGDTNYNPWCVFGGTATAVCRIEDIIVPENAQVGDVLVLTKPLGTQTATFVYPWIQDAKKWETVDDVISVQDMKNAYLQAVDSMARLNKIAANLMKLYDAHAATDVTGFGLIGHAENLARYQKNEVTFLIKKLPIFAHMAAVNLKLNNRFKLTDGSGIETSGGLLLCLPPESAKEFTKKIKETEGYEAWIIGDVIKGERTAKISDPEILNVFPNETC